MTVSMCDGTDTWHDCHLSGKEEDFSHGLVPLSESGVAAMLDRAARSNWIEEADQAVIKVLSTMLAEKPEQRQSAAALLP